MNESPVISQWSSARVVFITDLFTHSSGVMPYINSWEEFAKAAELLYLDDPTKCRFVMKYRHTDGKLVIKCTDNNVCLMYLSQHSQDIKKVEKLTSNLMRHMASKGQ